MGVAQHQTLGMSIPDHLRFIVSVVALVVLPVSYLCLIARMRRRKFARLPSIAFFVLFGTTGGWLLILSHREALWAVGLLLFYIFLITSTAACIASSVYMYRVRALSLYHQIAFVGGVLLPCISALLLGSGVLFR